MTEQCVSCIHVAVCAYRDHFEEVREAYKKVEEELKYPCFTWSLVCKEYYGKPYGKRKETRESEVKPNE